MKDIDELKRKWREIDIPTPDAPSGDGKIRREVPRSIKNRILRMQKRMLLIGILACMSAPSLLKIIELPRWFLTFYIGYFILAVIFNFIQIRMLNRVDFPTATTVEAISFVKRFSIVRARCRTILICLAVPLLITMVCLLDHEEEPALLFSAIGGCVIGAIIGIIINNKFKKNIALMRRHLGIE